MRIRLGVFLPTAFPGAGGGDGERDASVDGTCFGSIFRMAIRISLRISESVWVSYAFFSVGRARRRRLASAESLARMAARGAPYTDALSMPSFRTPGHSG